MLICFTGCGGLPLTTPFFLAILINSLVGFPSMSSLLTPACRNRAHSCLLETPSWLPPHVFPDDLPLLGVNRGFSILSHSPKSPNSRNLVTVPPIVQSSAPKRTAITGPLYWEGAFFIIAFLMDKVSGVSSKSPVCPVATATLIANSLKRETASVKVCHCPSFEGQLPSSGKRRYTALAIRVNKPLSFASRVFCLSFHSSSDNWIITQI